MHNNNYTVIYFYSMYNDFGTLAFQAFPVYRQLILTLTTYIMYSYFVKCTQVPLYIMTPYPHVINDIIIKCNVTFNTCSIYQYLCTLSHRYQCQMWFNTRTIPIRYSISEPSCNTISCLLLPAFNRCTDRYRLYCLVLQIDFIVVQNCHST